MSQPPLRAVTRNGRTHYIAQPQQRPPLTPDEIILRVVAGATGIVVAGALIWSTVAVGGMLSTIAPTWAAYMIAAVFDLAWIVAMAIEYVLRFEPHRQKIPKAVGWLALGVSMAAIFTHGALLGARWIGFFGALVSALAKGLWWLLMFVTTRRLDRDTQAWLTLELNEVHARGAEQQALAKVERERGRYSLGQNPDRLSARLDRAEPSPVREEPTPVQAADQDMNRIEPVSGLAVNRALLPEDQVDVLLRRLRNGDHITKKLAATILGVSESTAYRRLKDAESKLRQYN